MRVCRDLRQKIKTSKNNYEQELAKRSKNDPKLVYKYVKRQQNVNEQVRALVDRVGHLVTDRKLVADILNDQYKSVFVDEPEDVEFPEFISKKTNCFGVEDILSYLSIDSIEQKLNNLKPHKACGLDEVNSHVLKTCASAFSKPLDIIFRKSLREGYVPKLWKDANVTPIYKKGSRTLAVNYRNVSITSLVCRILEGLIRVKLYDFFEKMGLIAKEQHGFVKRKACVTKLAGNTGSDYQILFCN